MSGTPARAKREVSRPAKYADSATESDHKNQQVSGSRSPPFTQCRTEVNDRWVATLHPRPLTPLRSLLSEQGAGPSVERRGAHHVL
jgi:hypothetical protein